MSNDPIVNNQSSGFSHSLKRLGSFIVLTAKHFDSDRCFILASSVVYTTLISIVPFVTFIVSLLAAFKVFESAVFYFSDLFVEQFGTVAGAEIADLLDGFIRNAGGLGVLGLVSFLVTSVFLINRVWITINQIYHTPRNRNRIARFAQFITVLIIGTLLLGAYFSVTSLLSNWFLNLVGSNILTQWFFRLLALIGPWVLIWLVLFMLIFWVPSTKVKLKSALIGSICGTIAFQIANAVFSNVVIRIVNYSIIYGSLSSILIVLFWVFFLWIIIFGAVEIAYVHQYRPDMEKKKGHEEPPSLQLSNGIDIILLVARYFLEGKGAVQAKDLARELRIPDSRLFMFLDLFEKAGFIISIDRQGKNYIPAKPLESIFIADIITVLFGGMREQDDQTDGEKAVFGLYQRGIADITDITVEELALGAGLGDGEAEE
ncbi:MAG: YihY family inner membrane protein [Spirochaetales bacterium]|nr:YihY family inner membrane protein [Spirochaetales bacterium]